ncbi:hypothetical protein [Winogradskyella sp.]|uniref:hypothetical protein n=1 Tax=Winogradskyella sp. TaxID=1883156 RepID=UPI003BA88B01
MNDIDLIYYNHTGTVFYLKRCTINEVNRIQLVFNKRAFHLSKDELYRLKDAIKISLQTLSELEHPITENDTIAIKLDSSSDEFCVNLMELKALDDLICGTLFHLNFESTIADLIRL